MSIRRLSRAHFALYRGYLEGASIAGLHAAYGEPGTDVRMTRRLVATLRDTLAVAARRARDIEAAYLLRLKPGSLHGDLSLAELHGTDEVPTLEAYRERVDPDHFYGEAELLGLYRADFPPGTGAAAGGADRRIARKIARNARLRVRQAAALERMERLLVEDPAPEHPLEGWLEPSVAARLGAAGLATLADLLALIQRRRQRWYTAVPKLGPKGAQRITDWLSQHASSLGQELSPLATTPRRQFAPDHPALARPLTADGQPPDVVPIETLGQLRLPAQLDGSQGLNRAPLPRHQAGVNTDLQAVNAWLATYRASAHTARAYRREAERLLLWAIVARDKPLSSLNTVDCTEYIEQFLADPQPAARWVGRGRAERFHPDWRPFAGGLSARSRETARLILRSMRSWLVGQQYLAANPFAGLRPVTAPAAIDVAGRTLTHAQWQFVLQASSHPRYSVAEARDRFALLLAYATGLRRAELAAATTGALTRKGLDGTLDDAWQLTVAGKGGVVRVVPLPHALMTVLRGSLTTRGLPADPQACPPATPLVWHARTGAALTADGLGQVYKEIFRRAAAKLDARYEGAARDLRQASTHWLRHTHSNHALDAGADLRDVQANLGHASLQTTTVYVKTDNARRFRAMDQFFTEALMPSSE
jgi:site-specific recombinase XerD